MTDFEPQFVDPLSYAVGENELIPQRKDKDPEKINVRLSFPGPSKSMLKRHSGQRQSHG